MKCNACGQFCIDYGALKEENYVKCWNCLTHEKYLAERKEKVDDLKQTILQYLKVKNEHMDDSMAFRLARHIYDRHTVIK